RDFYEPEVKEVEDLLWPAYAKARKGVLVCEQYEENILNDKDHDTTKEEAWLLQEDLVVRRELLRLLRDVAQETHRLKPTGLFHKIPFAKVADTYESPHWRLELTAVSEAKGSKESSGGEPEGLAQA